MGRGKSKYTREQFIKKAELVHTHQYDYSRVVYSGCFDKVLITCKIHGDFFQTPASHLFGRGCKSCRATSTIEDFVRKSEEVHGFRYDYSEAVFAGCYRKIRIICRHHGPFYQSTSNHMNGHGCRKCHSKISRMCSEWLDSIGLPDDNRYREVILPVREGHRPYIADGFNPDTQTVYEFWGDFWHGNLSKYSGDHRNNVVGKTMAELNEQTIRKAAWIRAAGFRLVEMWESDWTVRNR